MLFKAEASAWTEHAVQLQQVWVEPALRGRGYAKRALADLCRLLLERDAEVCLFVRPENAPALALYESIGMRRDDHVPLADLRVIPASCRDRGTLPQAGMAAMPACARWCEQICDAFGITAAALSRPARDRSSPCAEAAEVEAAVAHTCSATDKRFIQTAGTNMTAFTLWSDGYQDRRARSGRGGEGGRRRGQARRATSSRTIRRSSSPSG